MHAKSYFFPMEKIEIKHNEINPFSLKTFENNLWDVIKHKLLCLHFMC